MSQPTVIKNAIIVNEGKQFVGDVLIQNGRIEKIATQITQLPFAHTEIDATGKYLIPGAIDDQVHFREPGLTNKACLETEARAAVAGGVTSFMEMPNTNPPALTQELLEWKYNRAAEVSVANYSFFMGASNDNIEEVLKANKKKESVCGVKIFMGSSTGNMLVDSYQTLDKIFGNTELLIATHCESEPLIRINKEKYKDADNASFHPIIRDTDVCYASSSEAVSLAKKHNSRLHVLHITTAKELSLFNNEIPLLEKRITSEVCVHHLHFTADDYAQYGNLIKCNPAIKAPENKEALWKGLLDNHIDVIATDHAPHTWEEKQQPYQQAPAGLPLVQHPVLLMMHYVQKGNLTIEKMVEKMSHAVADCFHIRERGYIREGYWADLVLIDPQREKLVKKEELFYKCGWSPLEGFTFPATIEKTFINGNLAYDNGNIVTDIKGQRLAFH